MPGNKPRILCVDDEPNVLEGLQLTLGRTFDVSTASSGTEGLARLREGTGFAAVVSDMRMPQMNGAEFLASVRELNPQIIRLLLTGQTDMESAVAAVNEGQIFRFLSKPCGPEQLKAAVEAAVEQHRLLTAERELLEQTLMGSLAALADILALANPEAFGRANRVKQYASELAFVAQVPDRWQVQAASMLSQVGYVTLENETMKKLNSGQALTQDEQNMVARVPQATERLLAHIPRLEGVRAILAAASKADAPGITAMEAKGAVVAGARVLRIALTFDRLNHHGQSLNEAVGVMRKRPDVYEPALLERFEELRLNEGGYDGVSDVPLAQLGSGMVLAEDVMSAGILLAPSGYVVTDAFVERVRNSHEVAAQRVIRIHRPARKGTQVPEKGVRHEPAE